MSVRYWRRMFTAFWMLDAERVPVRNVSRPSASGRGLRELPYPNDRSQRGR